MASEFHEKRSESMLSHPFTRKTGKPTGKISYKFLGYGKNLARDAISEIATKW